MKKILFILLFLVLLIAISFFIPVKGPSYETSFGKKMLVQIDAYLYKSARIKNIESRKSNLVELNIQDIKDLEDKYQISYSITPEEDIYVVDFSSESEHANIWSQDFDIYRQNGSTYLLRDIIPFPDLLFSDINYFKADSWKLLLLKSGISKTFEVTISKQGNEHIRYLYEQYERENIPLDNMKLVVSFFLPDEIACNADNSSSCGLTDVLVNGENIKLIHDWGFDKQLYAISDIDLSL